MQTDESCFVTLCKILTHKMQQTLNFVFKLIEEVLNEIQGAMSFIGKLIEPQGSELPQVLRLCSSYGQLHLLQGPLFSG